MNLHDSDNSDHSDDSDNSDDSDVSDVSENSDISHYSETLKFSDDKIDILENSKEESNFDELINIEQFNISNNISDLKIVDEVIQTKNCTNDDIKLINIIITMIIMIIMI